MSTDYGKFNGWENWQPNYINGNTLWLDGKDESNFLLTGSTDITIWYDKSGMGNNATQIISGNTPTYNSSNKSVDYSTGDYLDLYDSYSNLSGASTVIILGNINAFNGYYIQSWTSIGHISYLGHYSWGIPTVVHSGNNIRYTGDVRNNAVLYEQSGTQKVWLNGEVSPNTSGTLTSQSLIQIAPIADFFRITLPDGSDIKEVIMYENVLTNKEKSAVFQYLNTKHNIY